MILKLSRAEKFFLFAARLIFTSKLYVFKGVQIFYGDVNSAWRYRIIHPLALLTSVYETGVSKDFHMMRKRGLGNIQICQKHTCASFTGHEIFKYPYAILIAQGLENDRYSLFVKLHPSTPLSRFVITSYIISIYLNLSIDDEKKLPTAFTSDSPAIYPDCQQM